MTAAGRPGPGRLWQTLAALLLLCGIAGGLLLLIPGLPDRAAIVANTVTYPVASLGAGLLFVLAGTRRDVRGRIGWIVFGCAVMSWGIGESIWQWYVVSGREVPYPGVADLAYLAGYPLMLVGVLLMPHIRPGRYERLRLSLDALAGTVALAGVCWVLFLRDSVAFDPEVPLLENAVNALYPIGDVVLLVAVMILVLRRSEHRFDPRLAAVGIGLALTTVADIVYLLQVRTGSYAEGSALDTLWLFSYAALALGGWMAATPMRTQEQSYRPPRLWQLVAPYSAVVVLYGMTLSRLSGPEAFLSWTSTVVAGLIVLRQGVAIRENRELVEKQRDDLVASVSHELRTPLTAVQGYAQLLTSVWDQVDDDQRKDMVGTIEEQSTHLGRIVTDLIEVARDRLHATTIQPTLVSLEALVRTAVGGVPGLGDGSRARVDFECSDGLVAVDAVRMRQVVSNLVTNAVRYGRGRVLVRCSVGGSTAIVEVHDDGPGVPRAHEAAIWERFERGAHRFDADIPGSGIGLPVARALVEAHHGTIGYERSPHLGGACFSLSIPVHQTVSEPEAAPHPHLVVVTPEAAPAVRPLRAGHPAPGAVSLAGADLSAVRGLVARNVGSAHRAPAPRRIAR